MSTENEFSLGNSEEELSLDGDVVIQESVAARDNNESVNENNTEDKNTNENESDGEEPDSNKDGNISLNDFVEKLRVKKFFSNKAYANDGFQAFVEKDSTNPVAIYEILGLKPYALPTDEDKKHIEELYTKWSKEAESWNPNWAEQIESWKASSQAKEESIKDVLAFCNFFIKGDKQSLKDFNERLYNKAENGLKILIESSCTDDGVVDFDEQKKILTRAKQYRLCENYLSEKKVNAILNDVVQNHDADIETVESAMKEFYEERAKDEKKITDAATNQLEFEEKYKALCDDYYEIYGERKTENYSDFLTANGFILGSHTKLFENNYLNFFKERNYNNASDITDNDYDELNLSRKNYGLTEEEWKDFKKKYAIKKRDLNLELKKTKEKLKNAGRNGIIKSVSIVAGVIILIVMAIVLFRVIRPDDYVAVVDSIETFLAPTEEQKEAARLEREEKKTAAKVAKEQKEKERAAKKEAARLEKLANQKHVPKDILVGPSSQADYSSLNDAVSAAYDGDTIVLEPGVYNCNFDIEKDISIQGLDEVKKLIETNYFSSKEIPIVVFDPDSSVNIKNNCKFSNILFTENRGLSFEYFQRYMEEENYIEEINNEIVERAKDKTRHQDYEFVYETSSYFSEMVNSEIVNYEAYNLGEKNGIPWIPSNQKKKFGIGETINLKGKWDPHLVLEFQNGFQNEKDRTLYWDNARLKSFKISCKESKKEKTMTVKDIMDTQVIDIRDLIPEEETESITVVIEVLGVYYGNKYTDLCINYIGSNFIEDVIDDKNDTNEDNGILGKKVAFSENPTDSDFMSSFMSISDVEFDSVIFTEINRNIVTLKNENAVFNNCAFMNFKENGLLLLAGSNASVTNSKFINGLGSGIKAKDKSTVDVNGCEIRNTRTGIYVIDDGKLAIDTAIVRESIIAGIRADGNAEVQIANADIYDIKLQGSACIVADGNSSISVETSSIHDGYAGICSAGKSVVNTKNNTIKNMNGGYVFLENSSGIIRYDELCDSSIGLTVQDTSLVQSESIKVHDNGFGIIYDGASRGSVISSTVYCCNLGISLSEKVLVSLDCLDIYGCMAGMDSYSDCRLLNSKLHINNTGSIFHSGDSTIELCQFNDNESGVVAEGSAKLQISSATIDRNTAQGIRASDSTRLVLSEVDILDNSYGILSKGKSNISLDMCNLKMNNNYAIYLSENSSGNFTSTKIQENTHGVLVTDNSNIVAEGTNIVKNTNNGLVTYGSARGEFTKCKIKGNKGGNFILNSQYNPSFTKTKTSIKDFFMIRKMK